MLCKLYRVRLPREYENVKHHRLIINIECPLSAPVAELDDMSIILSYVHYGDKCIIVKYKACEFDMLFCELVSCGLTH